MRGVNCRFLESRWKGLQPIVWLVIAIVCLLPFRSFAGDFEAANQSYDEGKFAEAKQGYEKLIASGGGSPNVYYDLGNAEFRLDSPGRAILNYERALALNPHHPEARANLKLLRERIGAKLLPIYWDGVVAANLAPQVWSVIAAVSGWVVLFGLVLLCTNRRGGGFGIAFFSLVGAGGLCDGPRRALERGEGSNAGDHHGGGYGSPSGPG